MSMFCVMGDHEICEALGAQSIVHFSADPDAPSVVPCNCPCHHECVHCHRAGGYHFDYCPNYFGSISEREDLEAEKVWWP